MRYGLEDAACPYCRTPRQDPQEAPPSPLDSPAAEGPIMPGTRLGPYLLKAGAAFLGFLALAWGLNRLFPATLETAWSDFQNEVERTRDPRARPAAAREEIAASSYVYLSGGGPPPAAFQTSFIPRAEPPRPAPVRPPPPLPRSNPTDPPPPAPVDSVAAAAPAPPLPDPAFHRVYGVVYDVVTLRPIAGVKLLFKTERFTVAAGTTDEAGHYRIDLSKGNNSEQVLISIDGRIPGYRDGLFEDKDPPLRERPKDARLMIMSEITDSDLEPVPLRYKHSEELVQLDLLLVPQTKK